MHSRAKCENCDGPADVIDNGTLCATCWLKREYRNDTPKSIRSPYHKSGQVKELVSKLSRSQIASDATSVCGARCISAVDEDL